MQQTAIGQGITEHGSPAGLVQQIGVKGGESWGGGLFEAETKHDRAFLLLISRRPVSPVQLHFISTKLNFLHWGNCLAAWES